VYDYHRVVTGRFPKWYLSSFVEAAEIQTDTKAIVLNDRISACLPARRAEY